MTDFVRGDTVKLKSGGPVMTVTDIVKDQRRGDVVWTTWFDGSKKLNDSFPPETLDKASTSIEVFTF